MTKRNPIDALLDDGATAPSSARHVVAGTRTSPDAAQTSTPRRDHVALDVQLKTIDANPVVGVENYVEGENRKPGDSEPETSRPESRLDNNGKNGVGRHLPTSKNTSNTAVAAAAVDNETNATSLSNGEAISGKSRGKDCDDTGKPGPKESAKAAYNQQSTQTGSSVKVSKGRPQRRAKQSALGKLKAKHSQVESEASDDMTDDSQDDDANFIVQSKALKKAPDDGLKSKQLPTPVTNGNPPKRAAETKPRGKLTSVKPQHSITTNGNKPRSNPSARGTSASSARGDKPSATVAQAKKKRTAEVESTRLPTGDQGNRLGEQDEAKVRLSPKRPGALKRPARSFSRERKSQREAPYEFPGNTPATKKKGRSISRASKASTVRAGPTRQRMQSESVRKRLDRANEDIQRPSVSRQTAPKVTKATGPPRKPSGPKLKHDGSQPAIMSQGTGTAQKRDPHPIQSGRSNHTADADFDGTNTIGRQKVPRQKVGSSQALAITIEPDSRSGSSISPSPRRPMNTKSNVTAQDMSRSNDIGRPQTPEMMPSSPPGSGRESVYTLANDKPTIIAFSRQGPRNQGMSSAKKDPGSAAASKVFSDYKSAKAGTPGDYAKPSGLATQLFPPSSQHALKQPTEVTGVAEPSNVSTGEDNVFAAFTKNGKNKSLATMLRKLSSTTKELAEEDQDDGFAVIDDFEGTALINDSEQPTASQIAMPPPKVETKQKKAQKIADTSIPMPKKSTAKSIAANNKTRPIPARKAANVSTTEEDKIPSSAKSTMTLSTKDGAHTTGLLEIVSRQRPTKTLPTDHDTRSKHLKDQMAVQPSQQVQKRGSTEPHAGSPSKKTRVSHENKGIIPKAKPTRVREASDSQTMPTTDHVKRLDRRKSGPSRRATREAQGVDILGSPYPKDLEVPMQTTALEVFSQQTGLLSDQMVSSDAAVVGRLDLKAVPSMVPTTKAALMSSNGKPIPAPPQESSKAVTRIASGPLAEQLIAAKRVQTSEDNPFTSSRAPDPVEGHEMATIRFKEALRQRGINLNDQVSATRHQEREIEQVEDPEITLVEPFAGPDNDSRFIASSPGASETSAASSLDAATKALEDVGDWRNSLKPHQAHLFDSLVIAAHKLVRHMVDHETADRNMVADYRRRGEIIVTELQRAHAKEYQQYAKNVHGSRKQAADELAAHGRKLKQSMREAEKARGERKKAQLARNELDDMLEGLVAGLD